MSEFEREFPNRVQVQNVDATTPESVAQVQALGFRTHGLVIRSARGETLWKQPDHLVDVAAARQAIRQLLAKR